MEVAQRLHAVTGGAHRREWPSALGRAGLVGRGLLYLLVGWLATRIAFGDGTAHADQQGALAALARQPLGRWAVLALGVLFVAYALYRFALASFDPNDDAAVRRIVIAGRGALYLTFAGAAFTIGTGTNKEQSNSPRQRDLTLDILQWPAGRYAVAAIGCGVVAAGSWHLARGLSGRFAKDLKDDDMPPGVAPVVKVAGALGSVARGVAFVLVGVFLLRAGWRFDPSAPVGLDESLARLAGSASGRVGLVAVGAGLMAYGAFALGRARYQRVMGQ